MKKKLFFIFNPLSGKALIKNKLLEIIDVFVKHDYSVQVHPTQKAGEAVERTAEAAQWADLIVCCGGDGTLDEVVNGLQQADRAVPLGYIPAGSTNDFASNLQISRDMVEAARQIMEGEARLVDVGSFNDQTFVYVAAFGLFTEVSYETDQNMKNILGYVAYLLEGVKRIFDIKTYRMKVRSDTDQYEGEFIYGMVTNSRSVGGFKNLTGKNVEMDDGYFEVTLIHAPKNALEMNEIISCLLTREDTTNLIESFKTTTLAVEAETEVSWTLDGEYGGALKELLIRNQRQALSIILAPSDNRQIPLLG